MRSKVPLDAGTRRLGGVFAKVFQLIGAAHAVLSQYPDSQGLGAQDHGHEQQKQAQSSIHTSENLQDILHGHQVTVHRMDSEDGYRGTGYSREEFEEIMSSMGSEAFPPSSDGGRDGYPDEGWDCHEDPNMSLAHRSYKRHRDILFVEKLAICI